MYYRSDEYAVLKKKRKTTEQLMKDNGMALFSSSNFETVIGSSLNLASSLQGNGWTCHVEMSPATNL